MKTGIRTKFLGIISLATLVPLAVSVAVLQTFGYRHLVRERGAAFQAAAGHIASSLNQMAQSQVRAIEDFLVLAKVHVPVAAANQKLTGLSEADLQSQVNTMESRWTQLGLGSKELAALLDNGLARDLTSFRRLHPLFAEILVTDRKGRLIAATGKTSDYWQADERWWQGAVGLGKRRAAANASSAQGRAWLEGLLFDESSATFSLDIALPVTSPDGEVIGAVKVSLNASPFFSSIAEGSAPAGRRPAREIVREDGYVLLRLGDTRFRPGSLQVDRAALSVLRARPTGWFAQPLFQQTESMTGYAPLKIDTAKGEGLLINDQGSVSDGLSRMFVVVHEPAATVLRPVRRQVTYLTFLGAALVIGFGAIGLLIAHRAIVRPLSLLRGTARAVAATVRATGGGKPLAGSETSVARNHNPGIQGLSATEQLGQLGKVKTRDELESLARDFQVMGEKVLTYQQQLEQDIAAKTAAIQQDLDSARDFQAALMPADNAAVAEGDGADKLSLIYHHVYRPALTMGGDFFDVLKLSNHRSGVFIADVMGHGARSALITAILRTLLQTYVKQASDPALLLGLVNRQFYELTRQAQQTVFVTAFYLVADTRSQTLTCASAGHPSPLIARRTTRIVDDLVPPPKDNPALGLFRSVSYGTFSRALEPGDMILLYTDGVLEATNPAGEEFGLARLRTAFHNNLGASGNGVATAIADTLNRFVQPSTFEDDVCLVTLDIRARAAPLREVEPAVKAAMA